MQQAECCKMSLAGNLSMAASGRSQGADYLLPGRPASRLLLSPHCLPDVAAMRC